MKIAVMSTLPTPGGIVPDTFESSPAMLIVETDDCSVGTVVVSSKPRDYVDKIVETWCEAVVCGVHITQECFDPIADAGVTRYDGTGLNVIEAAMKADRGTLTIIPDFEGGSGCSGGTGECGEGHCH